MLRRLSQRALQPGHIPLTQQAHDAAIAIGKPLDQFHQAGSNGKQRMALITLVIQILPLGRGEVVDGMVNGIEVLLPQVGKQCQMADGAGTAALHTTPGGLDV